MKILWQPRLRFIGAAYLNFFDQSRLNKDFSNCFLVSVEKDLAYSLVSFNSHSTFYMRSTYWSVGSVDK
jgi:hypothetical protein